MGSFLEIVALSFFYYLYGYTIQYIWVYYLFLTHSLSFNLSKNFIESSERAHQSTQPVYLRGTNKNDTNQELTVANYRTNDHLKVTFQLYTRNVRRCIL